jgi:hypothetical protein
MNVKTLFSVSITVIVSCVVLFGLFGSDFFSGKTVLSHDNYYWFLPAFSHWMRSLFDFDIPMFDFYSTGGIPFGPLIVQLRLLDPFDVIISILSVVLTENYIAAFNLRSFLVALLNGLFAYLFGQLFLRHLTSKILLMSTLLFSCFLVGTFRQPGLLLVTQWSGLLFWLIYSFFQRKYFDPTLNLVFILALMGNTLSGYSYAGTFLVVVFGLLIFCSKFTIKLKRQLLLVPLFLAFCLPTIAQFVERDKFLYPARAPGEYTLGGEKKYFYSQYEPENLDHSEQLFHSYEIIADIGAIGHTWDFATLISPEYNKHIRPGNALAINQTSEVYFYFGLPLLFFLPLGFWYFWKHKTRQSQIFVMLALFFVGPAFLMHKLAYGLLPPIWPFRHAILIAPLMQMFLIIFCVKGFDMTYSVMVRAAQKNVMAVLSHKKFISQALMVGLIAFLVLYLFLDQLIINDTIFFTYLLSAIFFVALVSINSRVLRRNGLWAFVVLNSAVLLHHTNADLKVLLDRTPFDPGISSITKQDNVSTLVSENADLHGGCFMGNTGQALRYPGLLTTRRNVFAPPHPVGEGSSVSLSEFCADIDTGTEMLETRRWNSLVFYKQYFGMVNGNDELAYKSLVQLLPGRGDASMVVSTSSDKIIFSDVPKNYRLLFNLFYDEHWSGSCDNKPLELLQNKDLISSNRVEVNGVINKSYLINNNYINSNNVLPYGFNVLTPKNCQQLVLEYNPRFFKYAVYYNLVVGFFILVTGLLFAYRRLKPSKT